MALVTPENRTSSRKKKVNQRNKLDKIFSIHDDIQLIRGILAHGKKWKLIWEKYNLKHINRMSLKDRARSKAFKILLERAREDIHVLDKPNEIEHAGRNIPCHPGCELKRIDENYSAKVPIVEHTTTGDMQTDLLETATVSTQALPRIAIDSERKLSRLHSMTDGITTVDESFAHDRTRNSFMDSSIAGVSRINMEQWMNPIGLDEHEIDFNSIECDLRSYENLSPRIHWGGSILEDISPSPRFLISSSSSDLVDVDVRTSQELRNCAQV